MAKRQLVVVTLVLAVLGSLVPVASASAGWAAFQYSCEGITDDPASGDPAARLAEPPPVYLTELDDPQAATTIARWGVGGYHPFVGHEFGSSRVVVTYMARPVELFSSNIEVLIDRPAPPGSQEVSCATSYDPNVVVRIVLLSPVPPTPPSVVLAVRSTQTSLAAPGTYENRIVRSDPTGGDGCYAASPTGNHARLEKFCAADRGTAPALFAVVDITVTSDLVAAATPAQPTDPEPDPRPDPNICANSVDYFDDDAGLLYEPAINCLYRYELIRGYNVDAFGPNDVLLRQHAASMLVNFVEKARGSVLAAGSSAFSDIAGNTHEENINKGFAADIINGYADNTFRPMTLVSREQFVTLLVQSTEDLLERAIETDAIDSYSDDDGSVHELNIEKAHDTGILEGLPVQGDAFLRQANVTRGEAAQMIGNALVEVLAPARVFTP